ncbi:BTB/POZ domain-containing protein [Acorus gramineus]|uniref:BTB/POZ domain-containing protein n=1 Tax=Acorus gramineus TaxID=55184 RepID=A0AAV9AKR2_ACOGR|nr:BTB/POZ domain-containing protein [Acorus gramineus]
MLADSPDLDKLDLSSVPGGTQTFDLAVNFCYGTNFEINTANVVHLRCISEYLEMTEDYKEDNLISRTETYLKDIVAQNLEKSIEVLCASESLLPIAEEVGVVSRCIDAIALNASKEQLVSGLARLDCEGGSGKLKMGCQDWWVEDLSSLRIDMYQRVIAAMRKTGVRSDSITTSLMHYAQNSLKAVGHGKVWDPLSEHSDTGTVIENEQRTIVETLVSLLSTEKIVSVPLSFLFGMLRIAIILDASLGCRLELERRIGFQLDMVSLDDLLIPSLTTGECFFDVDTVHRILVNFLQRIEEEEDEDSSQSEFESEDHSSPSHGSVLKVGRLIEGYLAEIATDPYLKVQKFITIIELLPDYARVVDDGLYRAIDIYLKAHPSMTESECKKLCKLIDCQKLSQQAASHAAQNDRLPVHISLRVLYFEQIRLKEALNGNPVNGDFSFSQKISSGVPSTAVSPRDNYASLRRENRELKLEIARLRVRLSDLEKEQVSMKQGMLRGEKSDHGRAFFSTISRGIGRMGLFGTAVSGGGGGDQRKFARKKSSGREHDAKGRRRHRHLNA